MKIKNLLIFSILFLNFGCSTNNIENFYGEYKFKKIYITNNNFKQIKTDKKQKYITLNIENNIKRSGTILYFYKNKIVGEEFYLTNNNQIRPITFNNIKYKIKNNYLFISGKHWKTNLDTKFKIKNKNTLLIKKNENNIHYVIELYKK